MTLTTGISAETAGRGANGTIGRRVGATLVLAAVLVVAFVASLVARANGSYVTPLDGWGVDAFELAMAALCAYRFVGGSWRSQSRGSLFPLVLGGACAMWALGDLALTIESLGGASPPTPSVADGLYAWFFPICYLAFMLLVRRGNHGSLLATSLDGLIAGLAVASLSGAFLFQAVLHATGGGTFAAAANMAYPVGDVLLLALAVGAVAVLPKDYRRFLMIAAIAMATNPSATCSTSCSRTARSATSSTPRSGPSRSSCSRSRPWLSAGERPARCAWSGNGSASGASRAAGFAIPALGAARRASSCSWTRASAVT